MSETEFPSWVKEKKELSVDAINEIHSMLVSADTEYELKAKGCSYLLRGITLWVKVFDNNIYPYYSLCIPLSDVFNYSICDKVEAMGYLKGKNCLTIQPLGGIFEDVIYEPLLPIKVSYIRLINHLLSVPDYKVSMSVNDLPRAEYTFNSFAMNRACFLRPPQTVIVKEEDYAWIVKSKVLSGLVDTWGTKENTKFRRTKADYSLRLEFTLLGVSSDTTPKEINELNFWNLTADEIRNGFKGLI